MAIAQALKRYLESHNVAYRLAPHPHTSSSMETAEAAHVPGDRVAKAVLLRDAPGYLMAVLPSTRHLDLPRVQQLLGLLGRNVQLATENELARLFPDCEPGAVPPIGEAYGLEMILDDSLPIQGDIYFEAGDHEDLIQVSGAQFQQLMTKARRGSFSHHL